ncbi:alpha/beta hydrolase [Limnobacter parvus]|uniref:Alpha/beta hydrolase n=1 Tax=Limnobacter parvus TaxID=2939690 RepID=A0ABT1XJG2_9BURK|nr:alpha/beta hydrolase [Limnobacter parvus]
MSPNSNPSIECVVVETGPNPTACVIWLHGLGADGYDFVPIVKELEQMGLPNTRFVFPHAPKIPVSINGGYVMRAWYDIKNVDLQRQEDEGGIRQSQASLEQLINDQIELGFKAEQIVLAGFSQGGAIVYQTGVRTQHKLAGLIALSTYLPCESALDGEMNPENIRIPVLAAHGEQDNIVLMERGEKAVKLLLEKGFSVDWHTYPMAHSVCGEEVVEIANFLKKVL